MSIRDDNAMEALERSMKVLTASERGRDVLADLYTLLDGRTSGLGSHEWSAVKQLLEVYQDGWPGSVLDALRPAAIDQRERMRQEELARREDPLLRRIKETLRTQPAVAVPLDDVIGPPK